MIDNLHKNLGDITALAALDTLIDKFDQGGYRLRFQATRRIVTLKQLRAEYEKFPNVLAAYISPIQFLGGPPDARKMYSGSLLTLLSDRILTAWVKNDDFAEVVEGVPCLSN